MVFKGKAWKYGRDINTDEIISAKYLVTWDEAELGRHCLETLDSDFKKQVNRGDIIVAEENFGCGSSREHAPIAIKGAGISCVIAKSFARIFYRNSINTGLPVLESDAAVDDISKGDELEVDTSTGEIKNITTGKNFQAEPFPEFMQNLIEAGGLISYTRKKLNK